MAIRDQDLVVEGGAVSIDRDQFKTARLYDRIAPVYDLLDSGLERSWKSRLRERLFTHARGDVLDVGVGTGCNMPFYPKGSRTVGIDASGSMLERARRRAERLGTRVELRQMDLLHMEFQDASFDTVVTTFVLLCLNERQIADAFAEFRRIVRPGGQILILDYQLSSRPRTKLWMKLRSPWLRWMFGARFDPPIERLLGEAGLKVVLRESLLRDSTLLLVLTRAEDAA